MTEIYTPKEWLSLFGGSASLFIDDEGYIYSREEHYKIMGGNPMGYINYKSGYIYGKDYASVFPTPIATLVKKGEVTEVMEYGSGWLDHPILYIKGNEIYTPDEFNRIFGGTPSGYIKPGDKPKDKPEDKPKDRPENKPVDKPIGGGNDGSQPYDPPTQSSGGGGAGGCLPSVIGVALLAGIIYIVSDESRLAGSTTWLALAVNVAAVGYFLWKASTKGLHLELTGKNLGKGLLLGFAVYFVATAVFVLLGLVSNVGSGHAISDKGGDTMELSAMFMGLPFLISCLLVEGKGSAPQNGGSSGQRPPAAAQKPAQPKPQSPKAAPKTQPQSPKTPASQPRTGGAQDTKVVQCPNCAQWLRAPAGKGRVRITCPCCGKPFETDT